MSNAFTASNHTNYHFDVKPDQLQVFLFCNFSTIFKILQFFKYVSICFIILTKYFTTDKIKLWYVWFKNCRFFRARWIDSFSFSWRLNSRKVLRNERFVLWIQNTRIIWKTTDGGTCRSTGWKFFFFLSFKTFLLMVENIIFLSKFYFP